MVILTKIHEAQFIEDMYINEYLFFSRLIEFRRATKDKSGRLDPRELNIKNEQLKTLTVKIENREIDFHKAFKDFNGQYNEHLSDPKINCCSFNLLEIEPGFASPTLNKRLIEMGEKAMLIYDWVKFFEILDRAIEERGYEYLRKKVEYYNPKKFNGELTLHHKAEEFSWQNEYRILIAPVENEPVRIKLKGLKEISCVIESNDLETLRIENKN